MPTYTYPLTEAVHTRDEAIVRYLISAGASPNSPDKRDTPPLLAAAMLGEIGIAELLLNAGAELNARSGEAQTNALIIAAGLARKGWPLAAARAAGIESSKDGFTSFHRDYPDVALLEKRYVRYRQSL